ncbi:hypothetical protein [Sphingobium cupriresistens]|nr:hypothetical protein [Sphingobium cupriresistens]
MTVPTKHTATRAGDPLSIFREQLEIAADRAQRGCGLSDALFVERINAEVTGMMEKLPDELRGAAAEIAYEFGYDDGEEEPYHEPGTCFLTGIAEHCCPCGRHP